VLSPTLIASLQLTFRITPSLTTLIQARHVSRQYLDLSNDPAFTLAPYTVIDANVQWSLAPVNVVLQLQNLTNLVYASNGTTTQFDNATVPAVFIQAPRSMVIMASLQL
jgi:outer membrane receptor protein involved in Fe transport